MIPIEAITLFPNPNTPDLGCFVREKHGFETDPDVDFENAHVDFNPSIDFNPTFHQTYFRIKCSRGPFFQRSFVYMTTDVSVPPPVLQTFPPAFVLGGDYVPYPTDWSRFPTQSGDRFYWFFGQYRDSATSVLQPDAVVRHSYDIYDNGTLSTVQYSDLGTSPDSNSLTLEIAIVGRRSWVNLANAPEQANVNKRIEEKGIPRLRSLLNKRKKSE